MMKRMEKKREFFGLPIMFWGLWVTLLILWMGRFVTSFLSMYLVSDMHVSAGVAGTIVSMYGFGGIFGCLYGGALSRSARIRCKHGLRISASLSARSSPTSLSKSPIR